MEVYTRPSTSSELDKLGLALSKARPEYKELHNNRKANYGSYADIKAIYHATEDVLCKYEISINHYRTPVGNKMLCCTRIIHSPGQWMEDSAWLSLPEDPKANVDQAMGKSQSYNKRYALYNLLGIVSINDKDDSDYEDYSLAKTAKPDEAERRQEPIKQAFIRKITKEQLEQLNAKLKDQFKLAETLLKIYKVEYLADIPYKDTEEFMKILEWIDRNISAESK